MEIILDQRNNLDKLLVESAENFLGEKLEKLLLKDLHKILKKSLQKFIKEALDKLLEAWQNCWRNPARNLWNLSLVKFCETFLIKSNRF